MWRQQGLSPEEMALDLLLPYPHYLPWHGKSLYSLSFNLKGLGFGGI